jgi:uncharacterized membrane protein
LHNQKIKRMVSVAFLMALVFVMQLLTGIIPPIGGFSISLVLIPIVMGAALYGPGAGALLGATFGIIVYINCVTGADPGGAMVFQANPVLCLLVVLGKGILAGSLAGLAYKLVSKWNSHVAMLCAAIVCPVVNTGFFIACMLTFFKDVLAAWAGGGDIIAYIMTGLILLNFVPELILNIVFGTVGHTIVHVVKSK